jgi:Leucine-rich repeat (LRR) protein
MHPPATSSVQSLLVVAAAAICSLLLLVAVVSDASPLQRRQPAGVTNVRATCIPREREALLGFKQGITGDAAGVLDSWRRVSTDGGEDGDCCRWRGVRCSNRTGHVLELRLGNEHANYFSSGDTLLVGEISSSLLALERLEHLDLSWNSVEGSAGRMPEFLGRLKNLQHLDLSGVPFVGSVPPQLGNLSNLRYLDLSYMTYLNPRDVSWLTRLPLLEYLSLKSVNLSEVADDWPIVVTMIPSLRFLDLSYCSLLSANQSVPYRNLSNLQELNLSWNLFDHPIASAWFWNITSLRNLNLGSTDMFGRFPEAVGDKMASLEVLDFSGYALSSKGVMVPNLNNLCNLRVLNLGNSLLHGVEADELFENLPRCSPNKLQELHLSGNNVHGMLPIGIGQQLTSLVVLDLSQNNLTGPLPVSIGHLTSLTTLTFGRNRLTGHVPGQIAKLTNLTSFDLSHNHLDGVIREEHFDSLKKLQYIDLSSNSLRIEISSKWKPPFRLQYADFSTCQMGPAFPAWLQWMVDIKELHISATGISDRIPHWFCSAFSKAIFLNVSQNNLRGGLPADLKFMSVVNLDFNSNQLTGQIPPFPENLTSMDISMNSLSGPLPANFGPKLTELFLFNNRIAGRISESICNSEGLTNIDLADNLLEGELPQCFGNRAIIYLDVSNNSLSGRIPSSMQDCTELLVLDLSRNKFSGRLPDWIGKFVRLQFLRLSHNMFFGSIPINITNLQCLQYMDITNNSMSGSLPRDLSNLSALRNQYPSDFCSRGTITEDPSSLSTLLKGQQLNYGSIARIIFLNMKIIDLSINNLTGEIPEEIATLHALVNLNLSQNHFSGNVPSHIGAIQSLESLDLSRNNLSGEVPASLSNLTFLSYLDLSYNNLEGLIPSGSQLDTLYAANPAMYTGNIGLCGPPLKKNCSRNEASMEYSSMRTEGHMSEFFNLGLGCGFIVGILVVFSALLFKDGWRISYFSLLDQLYNIIYVIFFVACLRPIRMRTVK